MDESSTAVAGRDCADSGFAAVLGGDPIPRLLVRAKTGGQLSHRLRAVRPDRQLPAPGRIPADGVMGAFDRTWGLRMVHRLLSLGLPLEQSRPLRSAGGNLPPVLGIIEHSVREGGGVSSPDRGAQPGTACGFTTQGSQAPGVVRDLGSLFEKGVLASCLWVLGNSRVFATVRSERSASLFPVVYRLGQPACKLPWRTGESFGFRASYRGVVPDGGVPGAAKHLPAARIT